ncbi:MAG: MBL fold metallo-hydrolase [Anaerolineae bacterium]|nr:MBL fold metallo-hydrolase [Anaerolineae bacterium]
MVYVTFMGTGGAYSTGPRGNLALLVENGSFRMVIESGPLLVQQLAAAGLGAHDIDHIFISHSHGDHSLGFPMLALHRNAHPKLLHVYGAGSTLDSLHILCAASYQGLRLLRGNIYWHPLSGVSREKTFITEGLTLTTDAVPHPAGVPTLAARWDFQQGPSITFVTDTIPNPTTIDLARGSDLLIHDASYSATLQPDLLPGPTFHSTARQAGEVARQAGCSHLALVHLSPEIGESPEVLVEEARAGSDLQVTIPVDGQRMPVG